MRCFLLHNYPNVSSSLIGNAPSLGYFFQYVWYQIPLNWYRESLGHNVTRMKPFSASSSSDFSFPPPSLCQLCSSFPHSLPRPLRPAHPPSVLWLSPWMCMECLLHFRNCQASGGPRWTHTIPALPEARILLGHVPREVCPSLPGSVGWWLD